MSKTLETCTVREVTRVDLESVQVISGSVVAGHKVLKQVAEGWNDSTYEFGHYG